MHCDTALYWLHRIIKITKPIAVFCLPQVTLEYYEIRKQIFLSCSASLLPASMWMCSRKQQVRCVWKCICQLLCSCNTCVMFAWSRCDSTRLLLFFKAPADGQSATNLSQKRQKEEFIFFSGLNTISAQMLGTCNSAPISPMGCWSLSLRGEQAHCQSRRMQES